MKTLHTNGNRDIAEYDFSLPKMRDDQVKIKTAFCGVCRSDIAAYAGWEKAMPFGMQGHEGVGTVVEVGSNVKHLRVGDYVSSWSDPAYSDYYYASEGECVRIPELSKKYILQPVACAVNIIQKTLKFYDYNKPEDILILGSGFMSLVIGQFLRNSLNYTVCGSSNKEEWKKIGKELVTMNSLLLSNKKWKYIIDLSSKADNFYKISDIFGDLEAIICYAATPFTPITTNFFESCWNCHTLIMPSPRNKDFNSIMKETEQHILCNRIDPSEYWSKEYKRNDLNAIKQAFEDGVDRPKNYLRGFISWI